MYNLLMVIVAFAHDEANLRSTACSFMITRYLWIALFNASDGWLASILKPLLKLTAEPVGSTKYFWGSGQSVLYPWLHTDNFKNTEKNTILANTFIFTSLKDKTIENRHTPIFVQSRDPLGLLIWGALMGGHKLKFYSKVDAWTIIYYCET